MRQKSRMATEYVKLARVKSKSDASLLSVSILSFAPVFVWAFFAIFTNDWKYWSDPALEILRSRDVGSHTPLLGAYSRYEWSHPGAWLFLLLAVPTKIFENPSLGAAIFSLIIKWAPLSASVYLLTKKLGVATAAVFVVFANIFLIFHRDSIWTIWNPTIGLGLFLLHCILAFGWKSNWTFLVSVALTSLLVQFHIGYLVLSATITLFVFLIQFGDSRNKPTKKILANNLYAIPLLIFLWITALIDQFWRSNNLSSLIGFFIADNDSETLKTGLKKSLGIVSWQYFPISSWNGVTDFDFLGNALTKSPIWLFAVLFLTLVLLKVTRVRNKNFFWAFLLNFVLIIAAVIAIAQSRPPTYPYLFSWISTTALLHWTLVVGFLLQSAVTACMKIMGTFNLSSKHLVVVGLFASTSCCLYLSSQPIPGKFEIEALNYFQNNSLQNLDKSKKFGVLHTEFYPGVDYGFTLLLDVNRFKYSIINFPQDTQLAMERKWGNNRLRTEDNSQYLAVVRGQSISEWMNDGWIVHDIFDPLNQFDDSNHIRNENISVIAVLIRDTLP